MLKTIYPILWLSLLTAALYAQDSQTLQLSFVGDVMAHDVNFQLRDFPPVYKDVQDIFYKDDLTFANLEFPVDERQDYQNYPRFNVQRDYVQAVINAGMDVFSLANNHSYDQDIDGVYETLVSLIMLKEASTRPLYFSGIRGNLMQPFRPVSIQKRGMRIGFIAVTAFSNIYHDQRYVNIVNYLDPLQAQEFLELVARESLNYDLFIVSFHAGAEYRYTPLLSKVDYFKQIIAAGAHIVYAHHPHVLQPVEIIKENGLQKLIIYSAGNFISGQRWFFSLNGPPSVDHYRSYTGDSAIYQVRVEKTPAGVNVAEVHMELITNHIDSRRQIVVKKYSSVLQDPLSLAWEKYYAQRFKIMQEFLPETDILKPENTKTKAIVSGE